MNESEAFELLLSFSIYLDAEGYASIPIGIIHDFMDDMGYVS